MNKMIKIGDCIKGPCENYIVEEIYTDILGTMYRARSESEKTFVTNHPEKWE
jgi:hypothetical protein